MAKLHELISQIILSASLLLGGPVKAEFKEPPQLIPDSFEEKLLEIQAVSSAEVIPQKLILRQANSSEGGLLYAGHRSHRSHSSHYSSNSGHRSHQSHYSSYNTTKPSPSPDSNATPKSSPSTSSSSPSSSASSSELGSRVLSKGMSGKDVIELKKLLIIKGYELTMDETFDEITEVTLKDFQARQNIPTDGQAGPLTVYMLKK